MLSKCYEISKESKELGQMIRNVRKDHFMSQKIFAEELGTGQSVISAYENGKRIPSKHTINKIFKRNMITLATRNRLYLQQRDAMEKARPKQQNALRYLDVKNDIYFNL